jgi:hypothetical protein
VSSDDNIIQFPTNKIVEKSTTGPRVKDDKAAKRIRDHQTKQFVETAVDDISMNLLRQLYDLSIKTEKNTFTKDLAMVVDMIRGLVYRDFDMIHPAQKLSDKLVHLNQNKGSALSARIDYSSVIDKPAKTNKPLSKDVKQDLNNLNDSTIFEGDDLDE